MIKLIKRRTVVGALALIVGATILATPLVVYAVNPPTGYWQESKVNGNGVRHRKTAGDDGAILGLMYKGELIYLNPSLHDNSKPENNSSAYCAVWRDKTNLKGWMEWSYYEHEVK